MLRYLFFLIICALILAIIIVVAIRWIIPLFNYGKKVENRSLKKFSDKLEEKAEEKAEAPKPKPVKTIVKKKPGRPKKK